jgi:hypothetical protein
MTYSVARLCRLRPCCSLIVCRHVPSSVTAWCALKCCKRFAYRLRIQRSSTDRFPAPDPLLRRRPAESLRGALGPCGFGFRKVRLGSTCIGIHRRLTIRSSRPHVVASAACFALRLHASAAPPRVGLTQALGPHETLPRSMRQQRDSR